MLPLSSVFSKKKRLVIDASRHLNPYLKHRRVRLQDHREIDTFVRKHDYFTIEDLDSGYWHLLIHPDHQKFLGISINDEKGNPLYFCWRVLFLGISDAVFIFTLLLKPIRIYLAKHGIRNLIYLDDAICAGGSEEESMANRLFMVDTFQKAGFVVSLAKSQGPAKRICFLGLEICSTTLSFYIPEKKLLKIIQKGEHLLASRRAKTRDVASFVGLLQSCFRALGNVVRLRTRRLYHWMHEKLQLGNYDFYSPLSDTEKEEIAFWIQNIRDLNGNFFSPNMSCIETSLAVVTDASAVGMFGYQLSDKYRILLRKRFSADEMKSSSTVRELLALKNIYCSDVSLEFSGMLVKHFTDNQALLSILEIGSKKMHLQNLALEIYEACKKKRIKLSVEWRSREDAFLVHADTGSKSFDSSAYSLNFNSFMVILNFFEMDFHVDCMANGWNKKANIFFSRDKEDGSSGVNFFSQQLFTNYTYYCFPPPSLIVPTVLHFSKFGAKGLLVLPVWKSATFWFNIVPDGRHLAAWAKNFLLFKPSGFICDNAVESTTFKNPVNFEMLCIQFDFFGVKEDDLFVSVVSREKCIADYCAH